MGHEALGALGTLEDTRGTGGYRGAESTLHTGDIGSTGDLGQLGVIGVLGILGQGDTVVLGTLGTLGPVTELNSSSSLRVLQHMAARNGSGEAETSTSSQRWPRHCPLSPVLPPSVINRNYFTLLSHFSFHLGTLVLFVFEF